MRANSIFTNVALTDEGDVWWEGLTANPPSHLIDWKGNDWTPKSKTVAAHPNSRFTAPASQCPTIDPEWEEPRGVPISAILFGGRRKTNVPLVLESFDWTHGVFMGASVSSEQTAAAEGTVGSLRHDPFAMLPFCGYHYGDYFQHWINMQKKLTNPPKIYTVNWFRKKNDEYLWPGFGENIRVLKWVCERSAGTVGAKETPIGFIPEYSDLTLPADFDEQSFSDLFAISTTQWIEEMREVRQYFQQFGDKFPAPLIETMSMLESNLSKAL